MIKHHGAWPEVSGENRNKKKKGRKTKNSKFRSLTLTLHTDWRYVAVFSFSSGCIRIFINVLKIESMIESEKLSIHGSLVGLVIEKIIFKFILKICIIFKYENIFKIE